MEKRKGVIYTIVSAIGFGCLAIFSGIAYRYGANLSTVVCSRFLFASMILWSIIFIKKHDFKIGKAKIISLSILGGVGYNAVAYLYFASLRYIPTSIVALIFYSYPVIVSILSYFIFKESFSKYKLLALGLSMLGLLLIVGFVSDDINIFGVMLIISAAILYSVYIIACNKVVEGVNPIVTTTYISTSAFGMALIIGLFSGGLFVMELGAWISLFFMGALSTALSILLFFEGLKRIGPSKTSIISTVELLVTTALAAIIFSEVIKGTQIVGGVLIVASIIFLQKE